MKVENESRGIWIGGGPMLNRFAAPHIQSELELLYCMKGKMRITCGGRVFTLEQNELAIYPPNTVHSFETPEHSVSTCYIISMEFIPLIKSWTNLRVTDPVIHNTHPKMREWTIALDNILKKNVAFSVNEKALIATGYLQLILGSSFTEFMKNTIQVTTTTDKLPEILRIVHNNYLSSNVEEIALFLGYNPSYLSRMFAKQCGMKLSQYINKLRTEHSQSLLLTSDMSITAIAYESGFSSIRNFNQVFQELEGCTPREYRLASHSSKPKQK